MRPREELSAIRGDRGLLAAIVAACAGLLVWYGMTAGITFDGWWHLFVARQETWLAFLEQVRQNPHPPLYHLLLRGVGALGDAPLLYRSVGIAFTLGSTLLVGRICRRHLTSPPVALLAALAFGSATTTVTIANELRSYAVAGCFVLTALDRYLEAVAVRAPSARTLAWLATFTTLAVVTHYSAILLIPLFAATALVVRPTATGDPAPAAARSRLLRLGVALAPPPAIGLTVVLVHAGTQAVPRPYMAELYYQPGTDVLAYSARVARAQLALFAPLPTEELPQAAQTALAIGVLVAAGMLAGHSRRRAELERTAVALILIGLLAGTYAASLVGRYPFGGLVRHQYLSFLVGTLALFAGLDAILPRDASRRRSITIAALAVAVVGGAGWRWERLPIPRTHPPAERYRRTLVHAPDADRLVVGLSSLVPAYARHHADTWHSVGAVAGTALTEWRVTTPDGVLTVYQRPGWDLGLLDPGLYRDIAAVVRAGTDGAEREVVALELMEPMPVDCETAQSLARPAGVHVEALASWRRTPLRFSAAPGPACAQPTFGDGFESGDLRAWKTDLP